MIIVEKQDYSKKNRPRIYVRETTGDIKLKFSPDLKNQIVQVDVPKKPTKTVVFDYNTKVLLMEEVTAEQFGELRP